MRFIAQRGHSPCIETIGFILLPHVLQCVILVDIGSISIAGSSASKLTEGREEGEESRSSRSPSSSLSSGSSTYLVIKESASSDSSIVSRTSPRSSFIRLVTFLSVFNLRFPCPSHYVHFVHVHIFCTARQQTTETDRHLWLTKRYYSVYI